MGGMGRPCRRIDSLKGGNGMDTRLEELGSKELIDIADGTRYGYIGDAEVDMETGQIKALVIPGRLRWFGLLGREPERVFPWAAVRRFGEDVILVEGTRAATAAARRRKG